MSNPTLTVGPARRTGFGVLAWRHDVVGITGATWPPRIDVSEDGVQKTYTLGTHTPGSPTDGPALAWYADNDGNVLYVVDGTVTGGPEGPR